jgi:3-oxoacyl-[acyl-carrier-protein] synthase II
MTSTARRVVITGMGLISPLGNSKEALWESLSRGQSGVHALSGEFADRMPVHIAAEARQFTGEIDNFGPLEKEHKKAIRKGLKVMCRECQMGIAAAQLALTDAGLGNATLNPDRTGILFGADYMLSIPEEFSEGILQCVDADDKFQFSRWGGEGMAKMSPLWLLKYLPNMPASHLAIYNDFRGPNNSLTLREASANAAIGEAYQTILRNSAETMLVGATGTRLHPMKMLHAAQQEDMYLGNGDPAVACRPFDRDRCGMIVGEGAGAILLEELSSAQSRNATIYGEVASAASSAVAGPHLVAQRATAMANVLRFVLRSANVDVNDVGHIHAHGLSTKTSDAEEASAIQQVFGECSATVPVIAAKSYFGNLGAGSGLVELIASLLSLQHNELFPVLNYTTPDPECPLAIVKDHSTSPGDNFINLNVTPQGQAAAVMIRRYQA